MTSIPSEKLPDNDWTASTGTIQGEVITTSFAKQRTNLFHRIIDSFKRAPPSENVSIEMTGSKEGENGGDDVEKGESGLHRTLKNRHLQMIAIGGSIGTGLFVGSGSALAAGGPAALVLDFGIIGFMLFNVCMALGELAVTFPVSGSFAIYGSRFLDPAWGFAMGWNYALNWLIVMPLELTAAGLVINYWTNSVNIAVWITIFLSALLIINLFGVRGYGEVEFYVSIIKVIAVLGFIILGIVLAAGGGPNHEYLGGKYWHDPGPFANGFKGVCAVFVTAAFAFSGTELVGLAAAETANPRKTIPRATKQVFWRITIFYIVSLTLIGCLVPYTSKRLLNGSSSYDASASPFVISIENAGIKILPSIFNAVILCAVLSVGNSSVYGASRTLCALAECHQAPKILAYIDRKGRPLSSVALSMILGFIAYINCAQVGPQVFNWLLALSGLSSFFTWGSICACHIMFRMAWKAQGHTLDELAFVAPFGVWGSYFGLLLNVLCLIAQFYIAVFPINADPSAEAFFQAYLAAPIVLIFYAVWKIWKRSPFMRPSTIDLVSGRRLLDTQQLIAEERAERQTWPVWKKIYFQLC
jgi:amino acid transporter